MYETKMRVNRQIIINNIIPAGPSVAEEKRVVFREIHSWLLGNSRSKHAGEWRLGGYAGVGKALRNGTPVLTKNGWKPIEDLKVGDSAVGSNGRYTKILGVYPQGKKDAYRVTFSDGVSIDCCGEHLWTIKKVKQSNIHFKGPFVYNTLEIQKMLEDGERVSIPLVKPVKSRKVSLEIDPYLLGILIGDGGFSTGQIIVSSADKEIIEYVENILPISLELKKLSRYDYGIWKSQGRKNPTKVNTLIKRLSEEKLMGCHSWNKFIPKKYLEASFEQRLELLRGIFDSDGSSNRFIVDYSTTSEQLAKDVVYLVQSLGGTATCKKRKSSYKKNGKKIECRDSYRLSCKLSPAIVPFKLTRKANIHLPREKYSGERFIEKIEMIEKAEMTCIRVNAVDSLFVTEHFVLTHNTTMINYIVELCRALGLRVAVCAYTGKAVSVLRSKGIFATTIHKLLYRAYTDKNGNIRFKRIPNLECDIVIVDEGSMIPTNLHWDLRSHANIRRIIVGDPAQLAPVGADPKLMHDCDYVLEEIHRQGRFSPILQLAHSIRHGNIDLKVGDWGNETVGQVRITCEGIRDLSPYDIVICGYNATRHRINRMKRRALGYTGLLAEGEMVMCLKNDDQDGGSGLHNGVMGRATNIYDDGNTLVADITDLSGEIYHNICMRRDTFESNYTPNPDDPDGQLAFSYGYGITGHRSQASQWPNVAVKNEVLPNSDHARWLYTVVTRAEKNLTIKI